jgi:hypothetical protein
MKDIKVSIRQTDVKAVSFNNKFKITGNTQNKMNVSANVAVKLNASQPTTAVVVCRFEAKDEADSIEFAMETLTSVSVDTFVDNLDEVIKKGYLSPIMLAINEKIRSVAGGLGLSIAVPPVNFSYNGEPGTQTNAGDNIINFDPGKK